MANAPMRVVLIVSVLIVCNVGAGVVAKRFRNRPYMRGFRNQNDIHDVQRTGMNQITFWDAAATAQNESIEQVSCDMFPNHVPNSVNSYESVGCKPRKVIVSITSPITTNQFAHLHPTHVEVDRCSGMCASDPYTTKSCMPTETRTIEMPMTAVVMKSPTDTSAQCFLVKIEEHVRCECDCSIKEKHCHQTKQIYNKTHCRCDCKNEWQSSKCREDKIWDPVSCGCQCAIELPCSTGYLFHPDYCTCVKITLRKKSKKQAKAAKFERKVFKRDDDDDSR